MGVLKSTPLDTMEHLGIVLGEPEVIPRLSAGQRGARGGSLTPALLKGQLQHLIMVSACISLVTSVTELCFTCVLTITYLIL